MTFVPGWLRFGVGDTLSSIGCQCRDSSELARPSVQCVPEVVQVIVGSQNFKAGGRDNKVGIERRKGD